MQQWISCVFWLIIGIYITIHALHLGLGRLGQPGPGLIFFLAALLLVFLGLIDLVATLYATRRTQKQKVSLWSGFRWQNVLLVLAILLAYVYFLSLLGFVLSTFLLLVILFKAIDPTKWWIAIVASIITVLISVSVFEILLQVPFPRGVLGF